MADIKIHAGDFKTGSISSGGSLTLDGKTISPFGGVANVEIASEETVKSYAGKAGWAVAGAVVLGPVGALAGLVFGGRKNETTFIIQLKDGRKLLGTVNSKEFPKVLALAFK
ncbi:hypothetical protein ACFL3R_01380 [Thermodesulfobacteriota bacterium]